jgi:hypothetical protein
MPHNQVLQHYQLKKAHEKRKQLYSYKRNKSKGKSIVTSSSISDKYIQSNNLQREIMLHMVKLSSKKIRSLQNCNNIRASRHQILLGKSCVLPTSKKICQVKKSSSPKVWHNSLIKLKYTLHQEP